MSIDLICWGWTGLLWPYQANQPSSVHLPGWSTGILHGRKGGEVRSGRGCWDV